MIVAIFLKTFSQNTKFWSVRPKELFFFFFLVLIACSKVAPKSIHQIAWFQLLKYKIFHLLRGAHPPQTPPCSCKYAIRADAPPNHTPKYQRWIYAPDQKTGVNSFDDLTSNVNIITGPFFPLSFPFSGWLQCNYYKKLKPWSCIILYVWSCNCKTISSNESLFCQR